MKLEIENQNVQAVIDRVEDHLENKICKVVIKVIYTDEVEGQSITSSFEQIEGFQYVNTWEDSEIIAFAKNKINKRFGSSSLGNILQQPTDRTAVPILDNNIEEKRKTIWERIISIFK